MNDSQFNKIVLTILLLVILAILYILQIFLDAYLWSRWLNRMKNSSGNYNTGKILMMLAAGIALYVLLYYLFISKKTVRPSQSRSNEE